MAAPIVLEPSVAVGQVDHVPVEHRDAEGRAPDEGLHLGLGAPELLFGLLALAQPARELPDREQGQHGNRDGDRRCRQRGSGLAVELRLRDGDDHAKAGGAGARHGGNDGQSLQAQRFEDRRFPTGQLRQGLFRKARADEAIRVPAARHDHATAIEYRGRPSRRKVLGQQYATKLLAVHRRGQHGQDLTVAHDRNVDHDLVHAGHGADDQIRDLRHRRLKNVVNARQVFGDGQRLPRFDQGVQYLLPGRVSQQDIVHAV